MPKQKRKWILLARLSPRTYTPLDLTDEGIPLGLEDQVQRMREAVEEKGGEVFRILRHPRLSAYKKRRVVLPDGREQYRVWRPDLREAMDLMSAGTATGLMALDLDRAFRDPADLQDLLDLMTHSPHDLVADSTNGSMQLSKRSDAFDAQIRVLVANKSSKDTARRVKAAYERRIAAGRWGGGPRPYGFEKDGITPVKAEQSRIVEWSDAILGGRSVRSITSELNLSRVPTARGVGKWRPKVLREILLRPRNAGIMVYDKQPFGAAPWDPIIDEQTWTLLVARLKDPSRKFGTGGGRPPSRLGVGIYLCGGGTDGGCGAPMWTRLGTTMPPAYRCSLMASPGAAPPGPHVTRGVAEIDRVVTDALIGYISSPRAADLLTRESSDGFDINAAYQERGTFAERRAALGAAFAEGQIGLDVLRAGTAAADRHIAELDALIEQNTDRSVLKRIVGKDGTRDIWGGLSLGIRREILNELATVTILPMGRARGKKAFRDALRVEWKAETV